MVSMIEAYRMKLKFSENEVQCKLLIAGSLEEEKQKLLEKKQNIQHKAIHDWPEA